MSRLGEMFKRAGEYFMSAAQKPINVPEPQIGMEWHIVQHRAYANPLDGTKKEILASYQIASVDEKSVGILEYGNYYRLYKREKWDELYAANFAKPRDAGAMNGGGRLVPYYSGIREPINVERKMANIMPFIYINEPLNSLAVDDRKIEPIVKLGY